MSPDDVSRLERSCLQDLESLARLIFTRQSEILDYFDILHC